MLSRSDILRVTKAAALVLNDFSVRKTVLEDGFTRVDPLNLAERAGVQVMCRPLQQLLGAFVREERPGILLNSERPTGMIHMTCAHELGHYFLNHATTMDEHLDYGRDASNHELEADQFAYALMAPSWLVAHIVRTRGWASQLRDPRVVYQLSLRLGLSFEATVWTLSRQKRIAPGEAKDLAAQKPAAIKRSLLPAAQQVPGGRDVWLLSAADRGSVLQPRADDRFVLSLPDHGSAGFLWEARDAEAAGYELRPMPAAVAGGEEIWVGGEQQMLFEVQVTDQADWVRLDVAERQPWRSESAPADEVQMVADFEQIELGLTAESRKRLLEEFTG